MKGKIVLVSIVAVLLIVLMPANTAIEFQTIEPSEASISYMQLRQMDSQELQAFLETLTSDYPEISQYLYTAIHDFENTPVNTEQTKSDTQEKDQTPKQSDENQTLLEKIFWKIYNYRVIRLLISLLLFLKFQSKFTLLRTTTWGIRVLRWVKLGILLGYIDPTQQPTQTPQIGFQQDQTNRSLTVTYTSAVDIPWSDISEVGNGTCDPLPTGNVTAGDIITNCTGIIVLLYLPTYEVLGAFEFE